MFFSFAIFAISVPRKLAVSLDFPLPCFEAVPIPASVMFFRQKAM
jgi:hypothetical protein